MVTHPAQNRRLKRQRQTSLCFIRGELKGCGSTFYPAASNVYLLIPILVYRHFCWQGIFGWTNPLKRHACWMCFCRVNTAELSASDGPYCFCYDKLDLNLAERWLILALKSPKRKCLITFLKMYTELCGVVLWTKAKKKYLWWVE